MYRVPITKSRQKWIELSLGKFIIVLRLAFTIPRTTNQQVAAARASEALVAAARSAKLASKLAAALAVLAATLAFYSMTKE